MVVGCSICCEASRENTWGGLVEPRVVIGVPMGPRIQGLTSSMSPCASMNESLTCCAYLCMHALWNQAAPTMNLPRLGWPDDCLVCLAHDASHISLPRARIRPENSRISKNPNLKDIDGKTPSSSRDRPWCDVKCALVRLYWWKHALAPGQHLM